MRARARLLSAAFALLGAPALAHETAPPPPPDPAFELHLQCQDDEARPDEAILIDIAHSQGRIRVPPDLLPDIHGAAPQGWRPIALLSVEQRQITGKVSIGVLDTSTMAIDRTTGRIELSGLIFTFHGDCSPYEPDFGRRF